MKKLLWIVFILLIVAYTYWFGILDVPPGKFAVVYTKLFGVLDTIYEAGDFNFCPANLIPFNTRIFYYPAGIMRKEIDFSYKLPGFDELDIIGSYKLKLRVIVISSIDKIKIKGIINRYGGCMKESCIMAQISSIVKNNLTLIFDRYFASEQREFMQRDINSMLLEVLKGRLSDRAIIVHSVNTYFIEKPNINEYYLAIEKTEDILDQKINQIKYYTKARINIKKKMEMMNIELKRLEGIARLIKKYPYMKGLFYSNTHLPLLKSTELSTNN